MNEEIPGVAPVGTNDIINEMGAEDFLNMMNDMANQRHQQKLTNETQAQIDLYQTQMELTNQSLEPLYNDCLNELKDRHDQTRLKDKEIQACNSSLSLERAEKEALRGNVSSLIWQRNLAFGLAILILLTATAGLIWQHVRYSTLKEKRFGVNTNNNLAAGKVKSAKRK